MFLLNLSCRLRPSVSAIISRSISSRLRVVGGVNNFVAVDPAIRTLHYPLVSIGRQLKSDPSTRNKSSKFAPQHRWDKIPPGFELIYDSHIKYWIWAFQICMPALGIVSCATFGYALPALINTLPQDEYMFIVGGSALFTVLYVGLSVFARQFITRIYYHSGSGEFIAVRRTCFGRVRQIKYTAGDVKYSPKPGSQVHEGAEVLIKGSKCHLKATDFVSPMLYNVHLGEVGPNDIHKGYVDSPKF